MNEWSVGMGRSSKPKNTVQTTWKTDIVQTNKQTSYTLSLFKPILPLLVEHICFCSSNIHNLGTTYIRNHLLFYTISLQHYTTQFNSLHLFA